MYYIMDAAITFICMLPLIIVLQRNIKKHSVCNSRAHFIWAYIFCFYIAVVIAITGISAFWSMEFVGGTNFVPFIDIKSNTFQYAANAVLFVPLGVFVPMLWERYNSFLKVILIGFLFSLTIECLQLFSYRATDIDDLITNTLGAAIGYGIYWLICKLKPKLCDCLKNENNKNNEMPMYILFTFLIQIFVAPFFINLLWESVYSLGLL